MLPRGMPTLIHNQISSDLFRKAAIGGLVGCLSIALAPSPTFADENGISMWLPGLFGSLAAVPQQPGFNLLMTYYHTSVSAGGDVALARDFSIGQLPATLTGKASATVKSDANLSLIIPTYVFPTTVFGGQAAVGLMTVVGGMSTSIAGTVSSTIGTPFGSVPFGRAANLSDTAQGFGDLYPQASLRWNSGVNNFMTYLTGDIPVGTYDSQSLSNIGLGHGAIDAGGGYTYFDPKAGHEFSGVLGFTYNFLNPSTQYQSGVDMHFDWGASQFLTKQLQLGVVGYAYKELGCDSGAGDRIGCFQSQVFGAGPQAGYIIPIGEVQAYINLKGYKEFGAEHRPSGWNVWATIAISPTPPPQSSPELMVKK